ncbi:hypothetical protein QGP82_23580 [Leptothoe sp. LEGE 181152]|nr:hypothetical protein [Leptothoe sp. LEGE 181152]
MTYQVFLYIGLQSSYSTKIKFSDFSGFVAKGCGGKLARINVDIWPIATIRLKAYRLSNLNNPIIQFFGRTILMINEFGCLLGWQLVNVVTPVSFTAPNEGMGR